jgi:hypothetical protein
MNFNDPLTNRPIVNEAIAGARDLPGLLARLPPGMTAQLETKPLAYALSPPAVFLATLLTWVSTKYAIGWDANTCAMFAGAICLAAAYVCRLFTNKAIVGVVVTPPGTPPVIGNAVPNSSAK